MFDLCIKKAPDDFYLSATVWVTHVNVLKKWSAVRKFNSLSLFSWYEKFALTFIWAIRHVTFWKLFSTIHVGTVSDNYEKLIVFFCKNLKLFNLPPLSTLSPTTTPKKIAKATKIAHFLMMEISSFSFNRIIDGKIYSGQRNDNVWWECSSTDTAGYIAQKNISNQHFSTRIRSHLDYKRKSLIFHYFFPFSLVFSRLLTH